MHNALLLGQRTVEDESGNPLILAYYLLEKKETYGLRVVKTQVINNKEMKEEETVEGISDCKDYVTRLAECLELNIVTPICTREIIDDYVSG